MTLKYIIGFTRRREIKVIKFYVLLQPMDDVAKRIEESNLDSENNDATSMTTDLTMSSMDGEGGERFPTY